MEDKSVRTGALVVALLAVIVSGIGPFDRFTWFLEVVPVLLGVAILVPLRNRFPITPLVATLLALHAVILSLGGHYTYARVPFGFWMEHTFGFARNHYDRIGHFAQGAIPAILVREILLRRSPLQPGKWLFFIVWSVCLAISATYEFIEWWTALLTGEAATDFLGTQGDPWDTQWDMFLAAVGAACSQLLLQAWHDRQLARIAPR